MTASERVLILKSSKFFAKISDKKKQMIFSKFLQQQSAFQLFASKNSFMQSNEELIRTIQKAVETVIQAKLQSNASVQFFGNYRQTMIKAFTQKDWKRL